MGNTARTEPVAIPSRLSTLPAHLTSSSLKLITKAATFAGAGLCCVLTGVLSEYGDSESSKTFATIFALGGKFFSSGLYAFTKPMFNSIINFGGPVLNSSESLIC